MNDPGHPHGHASEPTAVDKAAGHELSDVSIRGLAVFLVGLLVMLALVVFAIAWLFQVLKERSARQDLPKPALAGLRPSEPPAPRLQESPALDMRTMRKTQTADLERTQWVDKDAKTAQIPIERAMQLVAERGLPDWPEVETEATSDNAQDSAKSSETPPGTGKTPNEKPRESIDEKQPSDLRPQRDESKSSKEEE